MLCESKNKNYNNEKKDLSLLLTQEQVFKDCWTIFTECHHHQLTLLQSKETECIYLANEATVFDCQAERKQRKEWNMLAKTYAQGPDGPETRVSIWRRLCLIHLFLPEPARGLSYSSLFLNTSE